MKDVLDSAGLRLKAAGIENPRREARILLAHVLGMTQEEIIAGHGVPNIAALTQYEAAVLRRMAREPLAYIVGWREFWSLDFAVGPGALVPRPESEMLVEAALDAFPDTTVPLSVLDLGTGSGCLLLAFLHERPLAEGFGVDASLEALEWAARNAEGLGFDHRARLVLGDWSVALPRRFDVVFVNPPYIAENEFAALEPELSYEPVTALVAGADGLGAYRQLAGILPERLAPGGQAFVEIGMGQEQAVSQIFRAAELETARTVSDLAGVPRCLVLKAASH